MKSNYQLYMPISAPFKANSKVDQNVEWYQCQPHMQQLLAAACIRCCTCARQQLPAVKLPAAGSDSQSTTMLVPLNT